jgi:hypothetical protein
VTNHDGFYIVAAVRGAIGPGDVVFPRIPVPSVVAFGVAVVVAAGAVGFAPVAVVVVGAAFAVPPAAASAPVGGDGDKLGGAKTG